MGLGWKVSSTGEDGRFVAWDDGDWTADDASAQVIREITGQPVMIAPHGSPYKASGPHDETWLFLAARTTVLPWPVTVEGTPPPVPDIAPVPDGAVA